MKSIISFYSIDNPTDSTFSYSLQEIMKYLGQPYIEWSDQLLGTHCRPVDYQHQWLLLLVNLLIHICSQNDMHINALDIVNAFCDYALIHFTEEELLFMDNPYPFKNMI